MQRTNAKGFTLIEMLVVIAIIAILATGATAVYTSSLQKSRDTTRIQDITALKSGVEQLYMDNAAYPAATAAGFKGVEVYVQKFPKDAKTGQLGSNPAAVAGTKSPYLDYSYNVGADISGVTQQAYKLSTAFENEGNVTSKSATDGGNDGVRWEVGVTGGATSLDVSFAAATTAVTASGTCLPIGAGETAIVIKGNCP